MTEKSRVRLSWVKKSTSISCNHLDFIMECHEILIWMNNSYWTLSGMYSLHIKLELSSQMSFNHHYKKATLFQLICLLFFVRYKRFCYLYSYSKTLTILETANLNWNMVSLLKRSCIFLNMKFRLSTRNFFH